MAIPLHADHLQPSDLPTAVSALSKVPIEGMLQDASGATDNDIFVWFTCPCAGILQDPFMWIGTNQGGGSNTTDVDLQILRADGSGTTDALSADMQIASAAADGTKATGAFASDAARTVAKGDQVYFRITVSTSTSTRNLVAGCTFVALGRTS